MDGPRDCHMEKSESEREKQIFILMRICGIQKNGTYEPSCKAKRAIDVENKHLDTKGGKGLNWNELNWETGIDIYTLLCIKQITDQNL